MHIRPGHRENKVEGFVSLTNGVARLLMIIDFSRNKTTRVCYSQSVIHDIFIKTNNASLKDSNCLAVTNVFLMKFNF